MVTEAAMSPGLQPRELAHAYGEQLVLKKEIGRGGFAACYKGVWSPGAREQARIVALKVLLPAFCAKPSCLYYRQFVNEATLLRRVAHRNIVACYDLVLLPPSASGLKDAYSAPVPCIILEFVEDGTVQGLIQEQLISPNKLMYSLGQAFAMALDIASAVAALHALDPPVIHRDLKLENMLLRKEGGQYTVKVADVGLHSVLDSCRTHASRQTTQTIEDDRAGEPFCRATRGAEKVWNLTQETGSPMYMAPEVYTHQPYNEKADVFSLGIMLYEIFGRTLLVFTHIGPGKGRLGTTGQYVEAVALQGWRPSKPKALDTNLWRLIEACWREDPNLRPTAGEVAKRLSALRDESIASLPDLPDESGGSWLRKGLGRLF